MGRQFIFFAHIVPSASKAFYMKLRWVSYRLIDTSTFFIMQSDLVICVVSAVTRKRCSILLPVTRVSPSQIIPRDKPPLAHGQSTFQSLMRVRGPFPPQNNFILLPFSPFALPRFRLVPALPILLRLIPWALSSWSATIIFVGNVRTNGEGIFSLPWSS